MVHVTVEGGDADDASCDTMQQTIDAIGEEAAKVDGPKHPPPVPGFHDLALRFKCSKKLLASVAAAGFQQPTCVQRHAMPCILQGLDLFCIAPTGSGKTLAFLLPGVRKAAS